MNIEQLKRNYPGLFAQVKAEVVGEELNKRNEFREIAQNEGVPYSNNQSAGEIALSIIGARKRREGTVHSMIDKAHQFRGRGKKY
ncbi:hypothetical protein [Paenibacillus taichungensis]|uniref:hypothetical protein n=1 Tax=Paenibacillus taichungensis TaxID=484184 RepID=UPI0038D24166